MQHHKLYRIFATAVFFAGVIGVFLFSLSREGRTFASPEPPMTAPATQPAAPSSPTTRDWSAVDKALERTGVERDTVYTISIPRDDVMLFLDGDPVPAGAGIASEFHFYPCPCGPDKIKLIGRFVTVEHETNDVIDELRKANILVASVAPLLVNERPKMMSIHFQAEGDPEKLASALREAIRWTGDERMAPQEE